MTIKHRFL